MSAIRADPSGALKFDKSSLTARAGKVTIVMDNPSDLPHAVGIEGNGVEWVSDSLQANGELAAQVQLAAGTYEVYCPIESAHGVHKELGMVDTLVVQ